MSNFAIQVSLVPTCSELQQAIRGKVLEVVKVPAEAELTAFLASELAANATRCPWNELVSWPSTVASRSMPFAPRPGSYCATPTGRLLNWFTSLIPTLLSQRPEQYRVFRSTAAKQSHIYFASDTRTTLSAGR
jgi:hypothetical protein